MCLCVEVCQHVEENLAIGPVGGGEGFTSVCQDGEVVALDIAEGEEEVFPAETPGLDYVPPALPAIEIDGVGGVDDVEENVVEEGLQPRDGGSNLGEQGRKSVGAGDAQRKHLTEQEHDPELLGLEVAEVAAILLDQLGDTEVVADAPPLLILVVAVLILRRNGLALVVDDLGSTMLGWVRRSGLTCG